MLLRLRDTHYTILFLLLVLVLLPCGLRAQPMPVLDSTCVFSGFVGNEQDSTPIVAAVLVLQKISLFEKPPLSVTSNNQGLFCFPHIDPGKYRFRVLAEGYVSVSQRLEYSEGFSLTDSFFLSLDRLAPKEKKESVLPIVVLGSVEDSSTGVPIDGAEITIEGTEHTAQTDSSGEFFILGVEKRTINLRISHPEYLLSTTAIHTLSPGKVTYIKVPLIPSLLSKDSVSILSGHVFSEDSLPVSHAVVTVNGPPWSGKKRFKTNSAGLFSFDGIPKGRYSVLITAEDYEPFIKTDIILNTRDSVSLSCALTKNSSNSEFKSISGKVVDDSDGSPLRNATIFMSGTDRVYAVDTTGSFLIDSLSGGLYSLHAVAPGYDTVKNIEASLWYESSTYLPVRLQKKKEPDSNTISTPIGTGIIKGIVRGKESGNAVSGAVVSANSDRYSLTNSAGEFIIKDLPPGQYTILIQHANYENLESEPIACTINTETTERFDLSKAAVQKLKKITVRGQQVKNTTASLLRKRQTAFTINDVIGRDEMSKSAASSAAEALQLITGITIVDDKYPIVRGLGDRYNLARLNGIELPSNEPDRRAVALDIFPAGLIDNITVTKTFNPSLPANWAGGIIDISTKAYPEKLTAHASAKLNYNSNTTFSNDFLTSEGGRLDWLGMDDGYRSIPEALEDNTFTPARRSWYSSGLTEEETQALLDRANEVARSFNTSFDPDTTTAKPDIGFSFDIGNTRKMLNGSLGVIGGFTYSNKNQIYREGTQKSWKVSGNYDTLTTMDSTLIYRDSRSKNTVSWSGLINANYKLNSNFEIGGLYLYTRKANQQARYQISDYHYGIRHNEHYTFREINYLERGLHFRVLNGKHQLPVLNNSEIRWKLAFSKTDSKEPDSRMFSNIISYDTTFGDYFINEKGDSLRSVLSVDTVYSIRLSVGVSPFHLYRMVDENLNNYQLHYRIPFFNWTGNEGSISLGADFQSKYRRFEQATFSVNFSAPSESLNDVNGDLDAFLRHENMGLQSVDTSRSGRLRYNVGTLIYWSSESDSIATHRANQEILSFFSAVELPILSNLTFVGGLRNEQTWMEIKNEKGASGGLLNSELLPALGLIFRIQNKMNLRVNYGKTLARPIFREKAEYTTENLALKVETTGNPDLRMSKIHNWDGRWEFFPGPGEVVAVSGYYKKIIKPIDVVYEPGTSNGEITWKNVGISNLYGAEFEFAKRLNFIPLKIIEDVSIGGNLTLLHTEIKYDSLKYAEMSRSRTDPPTMHPLQNASPYVINANISYASEVTGINAAAYFMVYGKRLDFLTNDHTPEVYEYPRPLLNMTLAKSLTDKIKVKFTGKNMLNPVIRKGHEFKGQDYFRNTYTKGVATALSLTYKF